MSMKSAKATKSRRNQSFSHGKDPSLNEASGGGDQDVAITPAPTNEPTTSPTSAPTITITETLHDKTPAESFTNSTTQRRPYPTAPSTIQTVTAYSLFSNPDIFSDQNVYRSTHYLTNNLQGKLWHDVNADGKRGDYSNNTLTDLEYDEGIPNVGNIYLVSCDTDEIVGSTMSTPSTKDGTNDPLRQSVEENAGLYEFYDLNTIPSGRYYVMYQSPRGWRMSGNTLPLSRRSDDEMDSNFEYSECQPAGGNAESYSTKAREEGDFDRGGYCARSVGCFEVGSRSELEDKYVDLKLFEETRYYKEVVQGDLTNKYGMAAGIVYTGGKYVALPNPQVLDVGLTQADWPLDVEQFADATLKLEVPVLGRRLEEANSLETLLSEEFASPSNFGKGKNRRAMKKVIEGFLRDNFASLGSGGVLEESESKKFADGGNEDGDSGKQSEIFALSGVDLFEGKVQRKKKTRDSIMYRSLRGAAARFMQEEEEVIEVTYTFTARGAYNPPPFEQLGYFVQNSINVNPDKLGRTLREDPDLPFQNLAQATSNHLTVGPPPPKPCDTCLGIQALQYEEESGLMEGWATIPVALLSVMIGGLIFLFFGRRVWKRRREVGDSVMGDMRTCDFATSDLDIMKEKAMCSEENGKKKKKHRGDETSHHSTSDCGSNPQGASLDDSSSSEESDARHKKKRKGKKKKNARADSSLDDSSSSEDSETRRRRKRRERKKQATRNESRRHIRDENDKAPSTRDLQMSKRKSRRAVH